MKIIHGKLISRNLKLKSIPRNLIQTNEDIVSFDFTGTPLLTFQYLPSIDTVTELIMDSTLISSFIHAPFLPYLKIFSCRKTPLENSKFLNLMSTIVFGDCLKKVNGSNVDDKTVRIANAQRESYRKYFVDGFMIINLNPLKLLNAETRQRKSIFVDFSVVPHDITEKQFSNIGSSVASLSHSTASTKSKTKTHSYIHAPIKKSRFTTLSKPKVNRKQILKVPKQEEPVYLEDDPPVEENPIEEQVDVQLHEQYLRFSLHILKKTVIHRRNAKDGKVYHEKTPLQKELQTSSSSEYSDEEFFGKSLASSITSEKQDQEFHEPQEKTYDHQLESNEKQSSKSQLIETSSQKSESNTQYQQNIEAPPEKQNLIPKQQGPKLAPQPDQRQILPPISNQQEQNKNAQQSLSPVINENGPSLLKEQGNTQQLSDDKTQHPALPTEQQSIQPSQSDTYQTSQNDKIRDYDYYSDEDVPVGTPVPIPVGKPANNLDYDYYSEDDAPVGTPVTAGNPNSQHEYDYYSDEEAPNV